MTDKIQVLQACTVEGNIVKLPGAQLDRKLYLEVAKSLELIGGKWKGGKVAGFVFQEDPTELLAEIAGGENRNLKKEYQFFATPEHVALIMADYLPSFLLSDLRLGIKILEPSAGQGALVKAVFRRFPFLKEIDCCELMEVNKKILLKIEKVNFLGDDFLELDPRGEYDAVIANPPFAKNQDIDHIYHMYRMLRPGGRIVTLSSPSWEMKSNRKQKEFSDWLYPRLKEIKTFPKGSFKESGTDIETKLLVIDKPM